MSQFKTERNFEKANGSVVIVCKGTRIKPMGANETMLWFGLLFNYEGGGDIFSETSCFLPVHIARRPWFMW
jgi:hypothetical protein